MRSSTSWYLHLLSFCLPFCLPFSGRKLKISVNIDARTLKFFGDILGICVNFFQIITYFLYVCQSIGWLTSIMKLGQYRDISYSGWDIFLKIFGHITGMFLHYFQINANFLYVCQSVSWLTSLQILNKYRHIICSDWDIFLNFFDTFLECLHTVSKKIQIICKSVSLLVDLFP